LNCPKCRHDMEAIEVDGVEVDRCLSCQGLWFDAGELDWLAQPEVAEVIDTGQADAGHAMNALTEIDCPRCGRPMKHVADEHKPDIRYEVCLGCEGAFLDAGEFSDLARLSIAEVLRFLIRRRR
jgi:Zn-finger nucleic acid-binding protein